MHLHSAADSLSTIQHSVFKLSPMPTTPYKTRRSPERDMIFGLHAVLEAIDAGREIEKILIRRDAGGALSRQLIDRLKGLPVPVQRVPVEKLNQFTDKNHQGVIAFVAPISFQPLDNLVPWLFEQGRVPLLVVLDGITDVRNLGAIARTCVCAGVDALIVPTVGNAAINADAVKASAGALHKLAVCRTANMEQCLHFLTASGIAVIAATEKAQQLYTTCDLTQPTAIVMGSEEFGIAPEHLQLCNSRIRIPMSGAIGSLNVSVSAGIIIYEALRQRHLINPKLIQSQKNI